MTGEEIDIQLSRIENSFDHPTIRSVLKFNFDIVFGSVIAEVLIFGLLILITVFIFLFGGFEALGNSYLYLLLLFVVSPIIAYLTAAIINFYNEKSMPRNIRIWDSFLEIYSKNEKNLLSNSIKGFSRDTGKKS